MQESAINFIKRMQVSIAKPETGLSDYKLGFVSNAENIKNIKKLFNTLKRHHIDFMDVIKRYEGKSFWFCFFKNDEINEDNKEIHKTYKKALSLSILLAYYLENEGKTKVTPEGMQALKDTIYVNTNGELKELYEIPLAKLKIKNDDISKKTFINCFTNARDKLHNSIELKRKQTDDGSYYVYLKASYEFVDTWIKSKGSARFQNLINETINSVRLDLDQVNNACEFYELLDSDGSSLGGVTKQNRAFIGKGNAASYCLIGNPLFERRILLNDYQKSFKFGNVYQLDLLLFLPTQEEIEEIEKKIDVLNNSIVCNGNPNYISGKSITLAEREVYLKEILQSLYPNNKDYMELLGLYEKDYTNLIYQQKRLRDVMNYRDSKQNNKLIKMKNARELGYNEDELEIMSKVCGDVGKDIYNRAFYIKFLNYLLDNYKTSGALYDLTPMTSLFKLTKNEELWYVNNSMVPNSDKEFVKKVINEASLDNFIATLKRFETVLNVDIYKKSKLNGGKYELDLNPNGFKDFARKEISKELDNVKEWKMSNKDSKSFESIYLNMNRQYDLMAPVMRRKYFKQLLNISDALEDEKRDEDDGQGLFE